MGRQSLVKKIAKEIVGVREEQAETLFLRHWPYLKPLFCGPKKQSMARLETKLHSMA